MAFPDHVAEILEPKEAIELVANARTHRVVVTNRRLAVADDKRVALQVLYPGLRRIQFDTREGSTGDLGDRASEPAR